jgi:hypothetical protein
LTGVSLLAKGLGEIGHADASTPLMIVALAGGALILAGAVLRRRLAGRFRHHHAMVTLFEGLECAFVGAVSVQRGTNYIQFAWLIAAIAFFGATVRHVRHAKRRSTPPVVAAGE